MSNLHGSSWIGKLRRAAIYLRDGERCLACGAGRGICKMGHPVTCYNHSLDHVVARARGGSGCSANLILLCCSCNSDRAARRIEEWRPELVPVVRRAQRRGLSRIDRDEVHRLAAELWPGWYAREVVGKARRYRNNGNALEFRFGAAA